MMPPGNAVILARQHSSEKRKENQVLITVKKNSVLSMQMYAIHWENKNGIAFKLGAMGHAGLPVSKKGSR